jgi:hypothetical protein
MIFGWWSFWLNPIKQVYPIIFETNFYSLEDFEGAHGLILHGTQVTWLNPPR